MQQKGQLSKAFKSPRDGGTAVYFHFVSLCFHGKGKPSAVVAGETRDTSRGVEKGEQGFPRCFGLVSLRASCGHSYRISSIMEEFPFPLNHVTCGSCGTSGERDPRSSSLSGRQLPGGPECSEGAEGRPSHSPGALRSRPCAQLERAGGGVFRPAPHRKGQRAGSAMPVWPGDTSAGDSGHGARATLLLGAGIHFWGVLGIELGTLCWQGRR